MLRPSNAAVHIVVVGVGAAQLGEAYAAAASRVAAAAAAAASASASASAAPSTLPCPPAATLFHHCCALDAHRVRALAAALTAAGLKYVSSASRGFAGLLHCSSSSDAVACPLPSASPTAAPGTSPVSPASALTLLAPLHRDVGEVERARFSLGALEGGWAAGEGAFSSASAAAAAAEAGAAGEGADAVAAQAAAAAADAQQYSSQQLPPHLFALTCLQDYSPDHSPYAPVQPSAAAAAAGASSGAAGPSSLRAAGQAAVDTARDKLRELQAAAGPAFSAMKSSAARLWDDFATAEKAATVGGGGGGVAAGVGGLPPSAAGGASAPPAPLLSAKQREQLSAAKDKAVEVAGAAGRMLKAALVTPPATTPLEGQQPGSNTLLAPTTLPSLLSSWSSLQSAAVAGARQLKEKAVAVAAEVEARARARAAAGGGVGRRPGAGAGGGRGRGSSWWGGCSTGEVAE